MSNLDLSGIPDRVMVDTSFLIASRGSASEAHSAICQELWIELLRLGRHILIPAVALAEFMRRPPHSMPKRHVRIEIVAFDERAAMALATKLPPWPVLKNVSGSTRLVTKYDEMILASAIRHRAEVLICLDDGLIKSAKQVKFPVQDARGIPYLSTPPPTPRTGELFPELKTLRSLPGLGHQVNELREVAHGALPHKKVSVNDEAPEASSSAARADPKPPQSGTN